MAGSDYTDVSGVGVLSVAAGATTGTLTVPVLDDADLEVAVDCATQGAFFQTGQRCTASSRLIVTAGIHDAFVDAMVERAKALRVGHALAEDTEIGPAVSEDQLAQDLDYLEIGRTEGAELVWGGERLRLDTDGFFATAQQGRFYVLTISGYVSDLYGEEITRELEEMADAQLQLLRLCPDQVTDYQSLFNMFTRWVKARIGRTASLGELVLAKLSGPADG